MLGAPQVPTRRHLTARHGPVRPALPVGTGRGGRLSACGSRSEHENMRWGEEGQDEQLGFWGRGDCPLQGARVHGCTVPLPFGWCPRLGVRGSAGAGRPLCPQGLKERGHASSGEAITSLPVSIPLSTVQPSKLPVSIPLASVVLPSRAEKAVSGRPGARPGSGTLLVPELLVPERGVGRRGLCLGALYVKLCAVAL